MEAGRAAVRAGRTEGVAFFEWACPDELDPCDEASWPVFHPAYGRTIGPEAMRSALDQFGPDEFARSMGNRWVSTTARIIPSGAWIAAADDKAPLPPSRRLSLGFDAALDRSDACIVAAWTDEGGVGRVKVADWREGAGWVADRVVELVERWRPVSVGWSKAGPARDIGDEIKRRGVALTKIGTGDYAAACAGFLEAIDFGPAEAALPAARVLGRGGGGGDKQAGGRRVGLGPALLGGVDRGVDGGDRGEVGRFACHPTAAVSDLLTSEATPIPGIADMGRRRS